MSSTREVRAYGPLVSNRASRHAVLTIIAMVAMLAVACGGGSASPGATATPSTQSGTSNAASATPQDIGPATPQADRIVEHMRYLSVDIGSRLAGSENAGKAAQYAQKQFESFGYDVEMQPFSVPLGDVPLLYDNVRVDRPDPHELHSVALQGSGSGTAEGTLIDAGAGQNDGFPASAQGAVVLIQRGTVEFGDMALWAKAHGAIGILVANNERGLVRATADPPTDLPFVVISQGDGEALRQQLTKGKVSVSFDVPASIDGTNVIARPKSGVCRTLSGGHYDTVPWAPGAEDNGSGAGLVLEVARAAAAAKFNDDCFVLFSGEEEGLLGSKTFVSQLREQERAELSAYFNYDVVAGAAQIQAIGDQDLATRAVTIGAAAGDDIVLANLPSGASSDHASFARNDIANMMLTVDDLGVLHTERDTFDFALQHTEPLQPAADVAFALIQDAAAPVTLPAATVAAP